MLVCMIIRGSEDKESKKIFTIGWYYVCFEVDK